MERSGRGVSCGGGRSSLGYLFGDAEVAKSVEPPKPIPTSGSAAPVQKPAAPVQKPATLVQKPIPTSGSAASVQKPTAPAPVENSKPIPAGIQGNTTNNYFRADGQNCGNFITDRPSTKVHAAPGGRSSLDYLFGGGSK